VATIDGAHVLVVGASAGMGFATAKLARDRGAAVTIVARHEGRLEAARQLLGEDVVAFAADASDEDQIAAAFGRIDRVDHAAIFAGAQPVAPLAEADLALFRQGMEARVWAALLICKYSVPRMSGAGSITLCSGLSAHRPRRDRSIGASATAALESFGRAMAVELAPIRVNTICPGPIATPMLERSFGADPEAARSAVSARAPLGRIGTAEEIADAALFFMGNGYVTGTTLHVDGGMTLL
jgi:NAD(P)-dependent dehydrogenase (short-subunit alcohol dehydrogenase family)